MTRQPVEPPIALETQRLAYENNYLKLYDDLVRFPDGSSGSYVRLEWNMPHSVAVLAVDEREQVLMIRQFSYALQGWVLQIPKGMGSHDLAPEQTAEKELFEETGFGADSFEPFLTLHADPGFISTPTLVFLAQGLRKRDAPRKEHSEVIGEARFISVDSLEPIEDPDTYRDPITIAAMLYYRRTRS